MSGTILRPPGGGRNPDPGGDGLSPVGCRMKAKLAERRFPP